MTALVVVLAVLVVLVAAAAALALRAGRAREQRAVATARADAATRVQGAETRATHASAEARTAADRLVGVAADAEAARREADGATARADSADARAEAARLRVVALEADLAAAQSAAAAAARSAEARSAEARSAAAQSGAASPGAAANGPAASGSGAAPAVESLWALEALARAQELRHAAMLSTAPTAPTGGDLEGALTYEIARIREEIGTPGSLRIELATDAAPADSLVLLRSVEALLAVLARHCQAYDLYLSSYERRYLATLVCEGFDGPDEVTGEAAELLVALAPVSGRLELDRDEPGRLRARMSVAASAVDAV